MPKAFETEAALCAAFLAAIDTAKWTAYAETAGWDILLVRKADGVQIGIEAKLTMNALVLSQAIEEYGSFAADRPGPDFRAVLVPESRAGFERVCSYIGVTIITVRRPIQTTHGLRLLGPPFDPKLPGESTWSDEREWHDWWPAKRHTLPKYVPDVVAGAPSPIQLTDWKIGALKVQITIEARGYVTREDFKHLGIDHRRWLARDGWLRPTAIRGRWAAALRFNEQHPRVYEEIKADAANWMLTVTPDTAGPPA